MKCEAVSRNSQKRYLVAALTAAWMALAVVVLGAHDGTHSSVLCLQLSARPAPQAPARSPSAHSASDTDNQHVHKRSPTDHHEPLSVTAMPRSAAAWVIGGAAAALGAVVAGWARAGALGGHGPHGSALVDAGQDILARFCLSRR